jgi:tripeptide aminopeptidase
MNPVATGPMAPTSSERENSVPVDRQRLLDRFLTYVRVDTTARDDSNEYPSSPGQLELGRIVVQELRAIGLADAGQDSHGLVLATIPATEAKADAPVIAFNSHFDTSPETTGAHVCPQVIQRYTGGAIVLPADSTKVITPADNPELPALVGKTLITTDGTTLLGADDKAGMAIMVQLAQTLMDHPHIPHGPVRLLFTCDEEIGRGTWHVDLDRLGADVCYTFDGGGCDQIDHETFSADLAVATFHGVNIHPSIGKDRLVNAVRAAGEFLARMPRDKAPERTTGRDGFLHPYVIEGGVAAVTLKILLRDFDTANLLDQANMIRRIGVEVERAVPGCRVDIEIRKQYRNMAEGLAQEPRAVELAVAAHRRLGREPRLTIIRGGTDGSQLTEQGLPTPNLSSGQHNPHSPLEFACLDEMVAACQVGIELVRLWGESDRAPRG